MISADCSAASLLGSAARIALLRALIRDASGGVRRPHAAAALVAATGVSPGRTRDALRRFAACELVEWRRGPGRSRRLRLREGPLVEAWLGPFFGGAEAAWPGWASGPLLPGWVGVAAASAADVDGVKRLADLHRRTIGFVVRAAFEESLRRESLWVARGAPVGSEAPHGGGDGDGAPVVQEGSGVQTVQESGDRWWASCRSTADSMGRRRCT